MKMNKFLKSAISWVIYFVILAGLVFGIPKGLSYFLKTEYPMASITSGSMWPELKKGDLVLIKGVENREEIKVGDIVVYQNPKGLTIHRVIEINEKNLITKGDANNVADSPVAFEEIIGKALTIENKVVKVPLLGQVSILLAQGRQ